MPKTLYEEALADVRQLKEIAEQNAKTAIMEAVTPKIKKLIEQHMLEDADIDLSVEDDDVLLNLVQAPDNPADKVAVSLPDAEGMVTLNIDDLVVPTPVETAVTDISVDTNTENVELQPESITYLRKLAAMKETQLKKKSLTEDSFRKHIAALNKVINECGASNVEKIHKLVEKTEQLYGILQDSEINIKTKEEFELRLEMFYKALNLLKENNNKESDMLNEEELQLTVSGLSDETAEAMEGQAAAGELDLAVEVKPDSVDLTHELEPEAEVDVEEEEEEVEVEEEGAIYELDLTEEEDEDKALTDIKLGEVEEGYSESVQLSDDTIIEISETELKYELARMKALREADATEVVTERTSNRRRPSKPARRKPASRERTQLLEQRNKRLTENIEKLSGNLGQYKEVCDELRTKLTESNLFNAKLLFTNKILQNDKISASQKLLATERLDEAKNMRELKLIYNSLVDSMELRKNRVTESTSKARRILGSSSKTTRTASATMNESVEAQRWAKLAGLSK